MNILISLSCQLFTCKRDHHGPGHGHHHDHDAQVTKKPEVDICAGPIFSHTFFLYTLIDVNYTILFMFCPWNDNARLAAPCCLSCRKHHFRPGVRF